MDRSPARWAPPGAPTTNRQTGQLGGVRPGHRHSGAGPRAGDRGVRYEPGDGTPGEVITTLRQIEGDSPMVEVEWPDSTADFAGVEYWTPREAREIGWYMVQAASVLDGGR